jgi:hypothetical protein
MRDNVHEGNRALSAFRLNRAWYDWAEQHEESTETFAFYEQLGNDLAATTSKS